MIPNRTSDFCQANTIRTRNANKIDLTMTVSLDLRPIQKVFDLKFKRAWIFIDSLLSTLFWSVFHLVVVFCVHLIKLIAVLNINFNWYTFLWNGPDFLPSFFIRLWLQGPKFTLDFGSCAKSGCSKSARRLPCSWRVLHSWTSSEITFISFASNGCSIDAWIWRFLTRLFFLFLLFFINFIHLFCFCSSLPFQFPICSQPDASFFGERWRSK